MARYKITADPDHAHIKTVVPFLGRLDRRGIAHEIVERADDDTSVVVDADTDLTALRAVVDVESL